MRFNLWIFGLILFISCHRDDKTVARQFTGYDGFLPDSSKQRLLKIIEGGWVNEEYINALEKYISPMTAAKYGLPEQEMVFDISQLEGDTLINARGRGGDSEGRRFGIIFIRRADSTIGMQIDEGFDNPGPPMQLNYAFEGSDTILLLTTLGEKTTTARFRRQFRRIPETDDISIGALEYFVNRTLFDSGWEILNANSHSLNGGRLTLNAFGQVKNFNGYKRYSVATQEGDHGAEPDKISFYNDSTGVTYAFTTDDTRISFYELFESRDGVEMSRGKLVCTLRKIP